MKTIRCARKGNIMWHPNSLKLGILLNEKSYSDRHLSVIWLEKSNTGELAGMDIKWS